MNRAHEERIIGQDALAEGAREFVSLTLQALLFDFEFPNYTGENAPQENIEFHS